MDVASLTALSDLADLVARGSHHAIHARVRP
jgi:hypothetical protein